MIRNDDPTCSASRRGFLKSAAAGGVALVAGVTVTREARSQTSTLGTCSDEATALLQRYGGEFGDIRPGGE